MNILTRMFLIFDCHCFSSVHDATALVAGATAFTPSAWTRRGQVTMMAKKSVEDVAELKGKKVLVRCDLNVPLDGKTITDDTRIRASVPTVKYLMEKGAKVLLSSHLGRPKSGPEDKFSLGPVAPRLSELLGKDVVMAPDCIGDAVGASERLTDSTFLEYSTPRGLAQHLHESAHVRRLGDHDGRGLDQQRDLGPKPMDDALPKVAAQLRICS